MSFLRDVLKKNSAKSQSGTSEHSYSSGLQSTPAKSSSSKSYASSTKSSGGSSVRSFAGSIASFYSTITNGTKRIPKRRRPDPSSLGVPAKWYEQESMPKGSDIPGAFSVSLSHRTFNAAHSTILPLKDDQKPWLALVLFSHAKPGTKLPTYHNRDRIAGEVRLYLEQPRDISSIDVWFNVKITSTIEDSPLMLTNMHANLWGRSKGSPASPGEVVKHRESFKGKFPPGTYVFPFEFTTLKKYTRATHPKLSKIKNKAWVYFPPSFRVNQMSGFAGNIDFSVGLSVTPESSISIDDEIDVPIQYFPLSRRSPQVKTPFPFIPLREDWPYKREVIGGWTLTPFGSRGRLGADIVEVEGLLGIQDPAIYTAGETLEFSLILWSKNPQALEALGQPGAIDVGLFKSDIFGDDVLEPRSAARKNRQMTRLTSGRIWRTEDGKPGDDEPVGEIKLLDLPEVNSGIESPQSHSATSYRVKGTPSNRMYELALAPELAADRPAPESQSLPPAANTVSSGMIPVAVDYTASRDRSPSPTPSLEDDSNGLPEADHYLRLDGEVRVSMSLPPSFRYNNMGREYVLHLLFTHPQYSHISPRATGICAEVPIWYILDRAGSKPVNMDEPPRTFDFAKMDKLPIIGPTIPLREDAVRWPPVVGTWSARYRTWRL